MDLLTDEELSEALDLLPEWTRDGDTLVRIVDVEPGDEAMLEENVRAVADSLSHDPEVARGSGGVRLTLTTHSAGGITPKDVELAAAIDQVVSGSAPEVRSPEL